MNNSDVPELKKLKQLAIQFLSRREHSYYELMQKLKRHSTELDLIHQVLDSLKKENLQSDARFSEAYIRFRTMRGKGPERIKQELKQKQVNLDLIEQTMVELAIDWYQQAASVREKRFGPGVATTPKDYAKQYKFLYYRGFNADHIKEALS